MVNTSIGINQRIPIHLLEMALGAALQDSASHEYFRELAASEYNGENRIGKTVLAINRLTLRNPLFPFLRDNKEAVLSALRRRHDRPLLFAAVICAAYGFGYDTLATMGRYFHAQRQVNTALITVRMSSKYGSNRSLPIGLYSVLPMFIEAGMIARPTIGIYEAVRQEKYSDFAKQVYHKAFLLNNRYYTETDDVIRNPFFEFIIKQ